MAMGSEDSTSDRFDFGEAGEAATGGIGSSYHWVIEPDREENQVSSLLKKRDL